MKRAFWSLEFLSFGIVSNFVLRYQCHQLKENWITHTVTPAKAGVQKSLKRLDSGFRRNDAGGVHMRPDELKLMALGPTPNDNYVRLPHSCFLLH